MIKNMEDLRNELVEAFEALKKDPRRVNITKEQANAAGKIISSCAIQLEYAAQRHERPEIPFLGKCGTALEGTARKTLAA